MFPHISVCTHAHRDTQTGWQTDWQTRRKKMCTSLSSDLPAPSNLHRNNTVHPWEEPGEQLFVFLSCDLDAFFHATWCRRESVPEKSTVRWCHCSSATCTQLYGEGGKSSSTCSKCYVILVRGGNKGWLLKHCCYLQRAFLWQGYRCCGDMVEMMQGHESLKNILHSIFIHQWLIFLSMQRQAFLICLFMHIMQQKKSFCSSGLDLGNI